MISANYLLMPTKSLNTVINQKVSGKILQGQKDLKLQEKKLEEGIQMIRDKLGINWQELLTQILPTVTL